VTKKARSGGLSSLHGRRTFAVPQATQNAGDLGAVNRCGAIEDLSILTSSLGFALTRIINLGRPII